MVVPVTALQIRSLSRFSIFFDPQPFSPLLPVRKGREVVRTYGIEIRAFGSPLGGWASCYIGVHRQSHRGKIDRHRASRSLCSAEDPLEVALPYRCF